MMLFLLIDMLLCVSIYMIPDKLGHIWFNNLIFFISFETATVIL